MTDSRAPLHPMREAAAWFAGILGGVVVPLFCGAGWVLSVLGGSLGWAVMAIAAWPAAGGGLVWLWRRRADPSAVVEWRLLLRTLSICAFAVGTSAAALVAVIAG